MAGGPSLEIFMDDIVKLRFSRSLGFASPQNKPEDCPQWLAEMYDLHNKHYQALLRNRECPNTEYALLATIAVLVHRLEERMTAIEQKLSPVNKPVAQVDRQVRKPEAVGV